MYILGAVLFTSIYYFSQKKEYKLCALIPALPIVGLYGLIIINNINNVK